MFDSTLKFLDITDRQLAAAQPELPVADMSPSSDENSPVYSALGVYLPLPERDDGPWIRPVEENSLPEAFGTVRVSTGAHTPFWKTMSSFLGPGAMIAVGKDVVLATNFWL